MARGRAFADGEREGIIQAVAAGESCRSISERTGRPEGTIRNMASRAGVGFRDAAPKPKRKRKRPLVAVAVTRKPDMPSARPDAVDVSTLPEARTADELQALLASIIAGKVICTKLQFDAISKQLDTARKDGAASETEEQAWVNDSAAFELRVAQAQHLEREGSA